MSFFFYQKNKNLVSLSNAILKHFTGDCFHTPLKELDELLAKKQYNKIVLMLFDGMGKSISETHLNNTDFLIKKKAFEISSVFPPTTAAATTALCSAKYPIETGWLGWRQYFKNQNVVVDMFTNNNSITHEHINGPFLSSVYCPYESIFDILSKNGIDSKAILPRSIDDIGPSNIDEFFQLADVLMKRNNSHFYYMYWTDPDKLIHQYGVNHPLVKRVIKKINKSLIKLSKENKDNLIIVLSDHSLIDTKFYNILEHKDFMDTLITVPSLDSRSAFFHVKSGMNEVFESLFKKYYGNDFILYTKQEILDMNFFGVGEEHPLFKDFLGDYMATSISNYGFTFEKDNLMIGAHSGSLEEESLINVYILNK